METFKIIRKTDTRKGIVEKVEIKSVPDLWIAKSYVVKLSPVIVRDLLVSDAQTVTLELRRESDNEQLHSITFHNLQS